MICTLATLDKAIEYLEKYKKSLPDKRNTLLKRLEEIGVNLAKVKFAEAQYDGINDVTVGSWIDENKLVIDASGQAVSFIEFGAGVFNPIHHPLEEQFGALRGEYGKGYGKNAEWGFESTGAEQLSAGGYVSHSRNGDYVITGGNNANRCLFDTSEELKQELTKIAREVFHD